VAQLKSDATWMAVRPFAEGSAGWLIAYASLLDRGEALSALGVGADGVPVDVPTEVRQTPDHIAWLDVQPLEGSALCAWAEQPPAGGPSVFSAAVDARGKPKIEPVRLARDVRRWLSVSTAGKAYAALAPWSGATVEWHPLGDTGQDKGPPLVLAGYSQAAGDVQAARLGEGWLLAWTDVGALQRSKVVLTAVDSDGRSAAPRALASDEPSVLVALAGGSEAAALAWERAGTRGANEPRTIQVVSVPYSEGSTVAPHSVDLRVAGSPELVAYEGGFAMLAAAPMCRRGDGSQPCAGPLVPTFVRLGADLGVRQAEPLFLDDARQPAAMGWALSCSKAGRCTALVAAGDGPTQVSAVDLPIRVSPFLAPLEVPALSVARTVDATTTANAEGVEEAAALALGKSTFVAVLTAEADQGPQRRGSAASRASIWSQLVDPGGAQPLALLFSHVAATGGLSLAPAGGPEEGVALAWVARGAAGDEVRVAHVSATGHLLESVHLPASDATAGRVALAWSGDGWTLAWIEGKPGRERVMAEKLGRRLQRRSPAVRVTKGSASPADLAIAAGGELTWLAWSDARESPTEGLADIYATVLRSADASVAGDEVRVLASARHSRSPSLVAAGRDRARVAWIEDVAGGVEGRASAMWADLDARAHVTRGPAELLLGGEGQAESVELAVGSDEAEGERASQAATAAGTVRVAALRSSPGGVFLDCASEGADGAFTASSALTEVMAPPSFEVPFAFAGNRVVFVEGDASSLRPKSLRHARVVWGAGGAQLPSVPSR
jgi:hypothetical protein